MSHSGQGNEQQPPAHEGVVLPAHGEPWVPDQQPTPVAGQPWGQPWGPETQQQDQPAQQPPQQQPNRPPQPPQQPHRQPPPQPPQHYAPQLPPPPQYRPPVPPQLPPPQQQNQQQQPPRFPQEPPPPLPSEETQLLSPVAAHADADATRFIPPTAGGPLPPERPAESTRFLGRHTAGQAPPPPEGGADAEATQFMAPIPAAPAPVTPAPVPAAAPAPPPPGRAPFGIRPGMPGDRQPPAEFDGLFREDEPPEAPDSTQQMPVFDGTQERPPRQRPHTPPHQAQQQAPQQPQGRAARRSAERKRSLSPMALAGIVLVGCVVAGLAAGAGLSSGDEGSSGDDKEPIAASDSPSPAEDPVETQAKALDKLLAASNDSRSSVIKAVKNIGTCTNLPQAAEDLREAAEQRNGLVTELGELSVDRLPDHKALTASLTSAWKASAAADSHYAGWADQVAGKKGCPGGKAKATGRTAMGNQSSGEATAAKKKAARLWNPIARDHGLPERQYLDL